MKYTTEEKQNIRSNISALLDCMINVSQLTNEPPTVTVNKFMDIQLKVAGMSFIDATHILRSEIEELDRIAVKKQAASNTKLQEGEMMVISKEAFKKVWGMLGDFDLDRILEEAEECDKESVDLAKAMYQLAIS